MVLFQSCFCKTHKKSIENSVKMFLKEVEKMLLTQGDVNDNINEAQARNNAK